MDLTFPGFPTRRLCFSFSLELASPKLQNPLSNTKLYLNFSRIHQLTLLSSRAVYAFIGRVCSSKPQFKVAIVDNVATPLITAAVIFCFASL